MTLWSLVAPPMGAGPPDRPGGRSRLVLEAMAALLASAGTVLAGVGLMAVAGILVTRAADRPPILDLLVLVVAVRALGLTRPVLRYIERLIAHDVTFRLLLAVRRRAVEALVAGGRVRALEQRHGDLLSRMAGDVDRLQDAVLRVHLPLASAGLVGAIVVAGLMLVDGRLAAATAGLMLVNGVVWPLASLRAVAGRGAARLAARAAISADLVGALQGLADLVSFGAAPAAAARLAHHQRALDRIERRLGTVESINTAVGSLLAGGASWLVLWMLLPSLGQTPIDGVVLAGVTFAVVAAFEALEPLPAAWQTREAVAAAAQRVVEIVPGGAPTTARIAAESDDCPNGPPVLRLESVTVVAGTRPIVSALSRVIRPGARLAILGPTGCGKTTLLLTMEGVLRPTAGRVTLDGQDLTAQPEGMLHDRVAVLPQAVHLFNTTVRQNVGIARERASDADIHEALERAGLRDWVRGLPLGLDTPVGELGARLSGGERQRVGLARVFLSAAPIVLLDEPTAHLDVGTERNVLEGLERWAGARTVVMATHRPVDPTRWATLILPA